MSQIAQQTGIGRATLYKYFSDVGAILDAWHEQHVARHLEELTVVGVRYQDPRERLDAVLEAFALIVHERSRKHDTRHPHGPAHQRSTGSAA